ncbi:MAG: hypothetical protein ABL930_10140 [Pseudobdellovibrio sp.]
MMKIKDVFKIVLLFSISAVTLLGFQNCGNVKIEQPSVVTPPSVQAKGISGKICTSDQKVSDVSRYELNHFIIVNLTAVVTNSTIEADSNVNGAADKIENNLTDIPTIALTNNDTDSDGIPDFIEEIRGMKQSENDLYVDGSDQDGLNNLEELTKGSDPTSGSQPPELNLYSVAEIPMNSEDNCDPSQKLYQFNVENLQRISLEALNDTTNAGDTSLSHAKDENVFLIYVHLLPDRITEPDKKLFKIFRVKKLDTEFLLDLKTNEYSELPSPP